MPFHGNPFTKGRLFVHFSVVFPKTLPANAVTAIKAVLPKPTVPMMTGEEEECHMTDVDLSQFGNNTPPLSEIYPILSMNLCIMPLHDDSFDLLTTNPTPNLDMWLSH